MFNMIQLKTITTQSYIIIAVSYVLILCVQLMGGKAGVAL